MKHIDEMIYEAIVADESLMAIIGDENRVTSTCFAIPPDKEDNTPLPNIIITDDSTQNNVSTKDDVWEGCEDQVQVSVDVAADSPEEVRKIMGMVRLAVKRYMITRYSQNEHTPELVSLSADGIAWDWMKPCYYERLTYTCITKAITDDEQP